jgi:hypothetical protein
MGKTDTGFPTGSTMAGHFLFPNPPTQNRLTLWFSGMCDKQSTQGQHRFELFRHVPAISEVNPGFWLSGMHRVFFAEVRPFTFRQSGRMEEEEPFSRLTLAILFACVRVDTCHPWNCMRSTSMHHPCTSSLAKT